MTNSGNGTFSSEFFINLTNFPVYFGHLLIGKILNGYNLRLLEQNWNRHGHYDCLIVDCGTFKEEE